MCKPQHQGGQRCAAHTRKAALVARARLDATLADGEAASPHERQDVQEAWENAAVAYASTPTGQAFYTHEQQAAAARGDIHYAAALHTIQSRGTALREANRASAIEIARRQQRLLDRLRGRTPDLPREDTTPGESSPLIGDAVHEHETRKEIAHLGGAARYAWGQDPEYVAQLAHAYRTDRAADQMTTGERMNPANARRIRAEADAAARQQANDHNVFFADFD